MTNNDRIVDLMSKAFMDTAKDIAEEEVPETAEEKKNRQEINVSGSGLFNNKDEVSFDDED